MYWSALYSNGLIIIIFSALICPVRLTAPTNGRLHCPSGQITNEACQITCDPGYMLVGSADRVCQGHGVWSGEPSFCQPMQCPSPLSPDNGYIDLPCSQDYGSTCSVSCFQGYNVSEGSASLNCDLLENGAVQWEGSDITCERKWNIDVFCLCDCSNEKGPWKY